MPIYEYECPGCGIVEVHQSIKDKELTICPKCSKEVKKLMSRGYFYFNHHLKH